MCSINTLGSELAYIVGAGLYTASNVSYFAAKAETVPATTVRLTARVPQKVTGKPSSAAFDLVATRLGVERNTIAVIGDDPRVEMAEACNALGIGIKTGTTSRAEWLAQPIASKPDHVIDSLAELFSLDIFGGL